MLSFLSKFIAWLIEPFAVKPRIVCDRHMWIEGATELRRRTLGGRRESGAFLIGEAPASGPKVIRGFIFYDDIDPHSLDTGIVRFDGNKLPLLWEICRARGVGVVADIHVHPGDYGQSASDQADPVMPRAGHFAFILPSFAARAVTPGGIGQYEYLGNGSWLDHSRDANPFLRLR